MVFTDMMLIKNYNLPLSCKLMVDDIFSVTVYSYWSYYLEDNMTKSILFLRTKTGIGEGRSKKTNKQA